MVFFTLSIILSVAFSWSTAANDVERCESQLRVPSQGDMLRIRQSLNVPDSRPENRQRPGVSIPLESVYRDCIAPDPEDICRRVLRLEGSPVAGETVIVESGARFRIGRMGLNNNEIYISGKDRDTTSGIITYIRMDCSTQITQSGGMVTSGDRTPCTHEDINMLFVNLTQERCDAIRREGSDARDPLAPAVDGQTD